MSGEEEVKHSLEAMAACTKEDIVHWNWSIELVNSQVFHSLLHTHFFLSFSQPRGNGRLHHVGHCTLELVHYTSQFTIFFPYSLSFYLKIFVCGKGLNMHDATFISIQKVK